MACAIVSNLPVASGLAPLEFDSAELKDLDLGKGESMYIFHEMEREFSNDSDDGEMDDIDSEGSISPVPPMSPNSVMDNGTEVEKPNPLLDVPGEWLHKRERRHSLDFLSFGGGLDDEAVMERAFRAAEEMMDESNPVPGSKKGAKKTTKGKKKDNSRSGGSPKKSGRKDSINGKASPSGEKKVNGTSPKSTGSPDDVADSEPVVTETEDGDVSVVKIGAYTLAERKERIRRFHEKRRYRVWDKKIKYDCRKKLADSRPRVKGRFVKRDENSENKDKAADETVGVFSVAANVSDVDLSMIDDVVAAVTGDTPLESMDLNSKSSVTQLSIMSPVSHSRSSVSCASVDDVDVISSGHIVPVQQEANAVLHVSPGFSTSPDGVGKLKKKTRSKRVKPY